MARVLLICDDVPFPPVGGGRMRVWAIVTRLARIHELVVLSNDRHGDGAACRRALEKMGARLILVDKPKGRPTTAKALEVMALVASRVPPAFGLFTSGRFRRAFTKIVQEFEPEVALFEEESVAAPLMAKGRLPQAPTPFAVDVLNLYSRSFYARGQAPRGHPWRKLFFHLNANRVERFEADLFSAAAFVSCCSPVDLPHAERLGARRAFLAPNAVEVDSIPVLPPPASPAIGYLGTLDSPFNASACFELLRDIFPRVRARVPGCRLVIAGRRPPPLLVEACGNAEGVVLLDSPAEVGAFYASISVMVVPLREGGGTRVKIIEAMAYGRPVVATAIAAEGLYAGETSPLLVAESTEGMAEGACRLLLDGSEWEDRASAGRELVEQGYDWNKTLEPLLEAVSSAPALGSGAAK